MFRKDFDLMFAKGRLAVCFKHKFYLTLIPKNLSSSAIYFILRADYPEIADQIDTNSPGLIHKYTGLILVKSLDLDASYKRIAIIREPFERILSAFYSKFLFDAAWSENITMPVCKFLKKDIEAISFRDFIFFLQCHPDEWLDAHFASQSRFMLFEDYDEYLPIHNKEALNGGLKKLGVDLPRINSTKDRYTPDIIYDYSALDCPSLPLIELWNKCEQRISLPDATTMLTSEIRSAIYARFKDDYTLLTKCLT
jgi:hypothetical protein